LKVFSSANNQILKKTFRFEQNRFSSFDFRHLRIAPKKVFGKDFDGCSYLADWSRVDHQKPICTIQKFSMVGTGTVKRFLLL
jgi:hypothetical protein